MNETTARIRWEDNARCAQALAEESDEEYAARVNAERAAPGLSPIQPDAAPEAAGEKE